MNIKKCQKIILKYFCLFITLIPIMGHAGELEDKLKAEYLNGYDTIFTARYVQSGNSKRYLVEDIYKGSVDKLIMDYVVVTAVKNEKLNNELILFCFRSKPSIGVAVANVSLDKKVYLGVENLKGQTSLDEIQKIINRQLQGEGQNTHTQ